MKANEAYRARRKQLKLTQAQLADILGIGRDTIVSREKGSTRVIAEHMLALDGIEKKPVDTPE